MVAVTVAAIALFLAVKVSDFFDFVLTSILLCILPTPLLASAVYGRADLQAFAIGALVPWVTTIAFRYPATWSSSLALLIWLLPNCAICGALAVATRRWLRGRGGG
jgi:hypothetical protein